MLNLLAFCLLTSFACIGLHVAITWPEMVLNFIEQYTCKWPAWLTKPLYACPTCMASIYTIAANLLYGHYPLLTMLGCILAVAGINTLICALLEKLTDYGC